MKTILLTAITFYQKILSPLLHQLLGQRNLCRYEVSCSEFAKQAIKKEGIITGIKISVARFLTCQPFAKPYEYI
jgi:putative component of membrane protein insertase Oxa1/YidC/SpoIIIJ protein YidD